MTDEQLVRWMSSYKLDESKLTPGWYALGVCWDIQEGVFPSAAYWTGGCWEHNIGPVMRISNSRFDTKAEAIEWADNNDPEGLDAA